MSGLGSIFVIFMGCNHCKTIVTKNRIVNEATWKKGKPMKPLRINMWLHIAHSMSVNQIKTQQLLCSTDSLPQCRLLKGICLLIRKYISIQTCLSS